MIPKKRKSRGSAALLDVAMSSLASAIYAIALMSAGTVYLREENIIRSADEQMQIARAVAAWIPENNAAIITAVTTTPACYVARDTANGWTIFQPSQMPIPSPYTAGKIACQSVASMGLTPANIDTNAYRQNYYVAIKTRTEQTPDDSPITTIDAVLFTANGQNLSDDDVGTMMTRFGYSGAGIFSTQPEGYNSNELVTFGREAYGIKSTTFTPGHTAISLTDLMPPPGEDSYLHRNAEPGNPAPNTIHNSMFMAGYDATNETLPTDMNMNGRPTPWTSLADEAQQFQNITNGTRRQPHNAIYGAHQVDAQILTAGSSIASRFTNIAQQTQKEVKQKQTQNEAGASGGTAFPNTITVNAGFDVTQGYRLSAADGVHITASEATYANDDNMDNDNPHTYDAGALDHNSAPYRSGRSLPGITWDNAPTPSGRTARVGLMVFLSTDPTGQSDQRNYGVTVSPVQTVISTYNRASDAHYPVGFEADGGARAPVFYDSRSMSYFVDPGGVSHMGDILLSPTNRQNKQSGRTVAGSLYTSGLGNSPWPDYWAKNGVMTFDTSAIDSSINAGQVSNGQFQTVAGIERNGTLWAGYHISAGFLVPARPQTPGQACLYRSVGYTDNQQGGEYGGGDVANWGSISTSTDGSTMYCSPQTGVWTKIQAGNMFSHIQTQTYPSDTVINNTLNTPLFVSTNCADLLSERSSKHNGQVDMLNIRVWEGANGTGNTASNMSQEEEGGKKGGYVANVHAQFIVPPNGSFMVSVIDDFDRNPFCTYLTAY